MPKKVSEVYYASNERDGKGVKIYMIHRLDNGHYRHTIIYQGGKSMFMDLPLDHEEMKYDRIKQDLEQ